jgi:hypothetical protein
VRARRAANQISRAPRLAPTLSASRWVWREDIADLCHAQARAVQITLSGDQDGGDNSTGERTATLTRLTGPTISSVTHRGASRSRAIQD